MVILLLALIRFCHFLDFMIMIPLGPEITQALSITEAQFNVLSAVYPLCAGFSCFFLTPWIDRFEKKFFLLICFFNFALATLLCGFAEHFWVLFGFRAYAGLFGGAISSLVYAYLAETISSDRRGYGNGVLTAAVTVALVLGAPFGLQLTKYAQNWQAPFQWVGALSLLVGFVSFFKLKKIPMQIKTSTAISLVTPLPISLPIPLIEKLWKPYERAFSDPRIRSTLILFILLALGQYSLTPNLTLYLQNEGKFSVNAVSWLFGIGGLFSVFAAPYAGKLSDRHGRIPVLKALLIGSILVGGVFCLSEVFHEIQFLVLSAITILFLVFSTARVSPLITHLTELADPSERGSLLLVQNTIQQIASSVANLVAGLLLALGANQAQGFGFIFIFSVTATVFGFILIQLLLQPRGGYDVAVHVSN